MLDLYLRDVKEVVCMPFSRFLARYLTATQLTIIGFVVGLMAPVFIVWDMYWMANCCWWLNRIIDGFDGVVARITNTQSDFGGYLDIICDFIVYALIPVALVCHACGIQPLHPHFFGFVLNQIVGSEGRTSGWWNLEARSWPSASVLFIVLALMMSSFFVNAASQMFLASILEKRQIGAKARKEKTTITMPAALIEGSETLFVYSFFLAFPQTLLLSFSLFTICVYSNVLYRLYWAFVHIN